MKRTTLAVAAATALLLLAGCSAGTQENVSVNSATSPSAAPTETVAPLTAETPAETLTEAPDEAAFVAEVRDTLRAENVIPNATDEQLVQAGEKACEMKAEGVAPEDISVIDGEQRTYGAYLDSVKIYRAAANTIC